MKLTTPIGNIELPKDFSMTMERNNPLLSGDGDASVPATLPSSPGNLAAIGHLERPDRAVPYDNKIDAILQVGPIQKRGSLVMDTVHRRDGIDASFAIDNSDLYAQAKGKTLKEIFNDYTEAFNSVEEACRVMQQVYEGRDDTRDYVICPVAVSPYDDNDVQYYQFNNEVNGSSLVYAARQVHEGDVMMSVPEGYGIAPFLKLGRMTELLFYCIGFSLDEADNCLEQWPFKRMVILHNCADCLCNPSSTLFYRDLVPSCTLSEFLDWLLAKFHVQPVVNSETRRVRMVSMEQMLQAPPDIDISGIVEGDFTVQLNPTSRVVIGATTKVEGAEAAADSFDKLIAKYGDFNQADEAQFETLATADPAYTGLVQRLATGVFYDVQYDSSTQLYVPKLIGTNNFTYDRANSDASENFSPADALPLMIVDPVSKGGIAPFIGDRTHAHTSYNGSTADDNQDIIVAQYYCDRENLAFYTTATSQPAIPLRSGDFVQLGLGTTPYDLYDACWSHYNKLLLNHATHLTGNVRFSIGQILGMDMSRLKLYNGQTLLPVSLSAAINGRNGLTETEYIIAKDFVGGIEDTPIVPGGASDLRWEVADNLITVAQGLWREMGGGANFGDIDIQDTSWGVEAHYLRYLSCSVRYTGENLNPGTPEQVGEVKVLSRLGDITIHYAEIIENEEGLSPQVIEHNCLREFVGRTIQFTFTAVEA